MDIWLYNLIWVVLYLFFLLYRNVVIGSWNYRLHALATVDIMIAKSDYELELATWYVNQFNFFKWVFNPLTYTVWNYRKAYNIFVDMQSKTIPDTVSKETWSYIEKKDINNVQIT